MKEAPSPLIIGIVDSIISRSHFLKKIIELKINFLKLMDVSALCWGYGFWEDVSLKRSVKILPRLPLLEDLGTVLFILDLKVDN